MAYVEILVYAAEKEIWERITEPGDKRFRFRAIETYEELSKNIKENPFQIVLVSEKEFKANPELSALVRQKEYLFILYSGSFSAEEKANFLGGESGAAGVRAMVSVLSIGNWNWY